MLKEGCLLLGSKRCYCIILFLFIAHWLFGKLSPFTAHKVKHNRDKIFVGKRWEQSCEWWWQSTVYMNCTIAFFLSHQIILRNVCFLCRIVMHCEVWTKCLIFCKINHISFCMNLLQFLYHQWLQYLMESMSAFSI